MALAVISYIYGYGELCKYRFLSIVTILSIGTSCDYINIPAQLNICLRAGNYLGDWSQLKFIQVNYGEAR